MRAGIVVTPGRLEWIEAPTPQAADLTPADVLIRPLIGGICGSDLPYFTRGETFDGTTPPAGSPLHEVVGTIEASRDPELEVGDLVVGWAGNNDALAELVVTAGADVHVFDALDPAHAVLAQPLACAIAVLDRLARPWESEHVAVLGLGPIGLLFTHLFHHGGAAQVTGVDPVARFKDLQPFGVDQYIQSSAEEWARGLGEERPAVVTEVVGHQYTTLGAAIEAVAPWGEVFYFGVPETGAYEISMAAMLRKQLTLQSGTTARNRRRYLGEAIAYLKAYPDLAPALITHEVPFDQAPVAYSLAARQEAGVGKVLLRFGAHQPARS